MRKARVNTRRAARFRFRTARRDRARSGARSNPLRETSRASAQAPVRATIPWRCVPALPQVPLHARHAASETAPAVLPVSRRPPGSVLAWRTGATAGGGLRPSRDLLPTPISRRFAQERRPQPLPGYAYRSDGIPARDANRSARRDGREERRSLFL